MIYRRYNKNDLHTITSRLRGHLPILGNKNPNSNKGGQNGVKWSLILAFKLTYTPIFMSHVHFLKFSKILSTFLSLFRPGGYDPVGSKNEF